MFHCGGGVGATEVDWLTPLIEWVEQGRSPERILGAGSLTGGAVLTRPLFPYPQVARYKGSGSIDADASFECKVP